MAPLRARRTLTPRFPLRGAEKRLVVGLKPLNIGLGSHSDILFEVELKLEGGGGRRRRESFTHGATSSGSTGSPVTERVLSRGGFHHLRTLIGAHTHPGVSAARTYLQTGAAKLPPPTLILERFSHAGGFSSSSRRLVDTRGSRRWREIAAVFSTTHACAPAAERRGRHQLCLEGSRPGGGLLHLSHL